MGAFATEQVLLTRRRSFFLCEHSPFLRLNDCGAPITSASQTFWMVQDDCLKMGCPCISLPVHFLGYPTDCARMIFWSGRSFITLAKAGLSMFARTTVASPSEAQ